MLETYRTSSIEGWNPSPVVALATSLDNSQVAAARQDGSLEIWLVSPGSVGWHCQLTIHGNPESRVSSLLWCPGGPSSMPCGRLLSSSIDGSVSEWDLFHLKQKTVLDSVGVSIWQMALEPSAFHLSNVVPKSEPKVNGYVNHTDNDEEKSGNSDSEDEPDSPKSGIVHPQVAMACDDGCVRIYQIADEDEFAYIKSLPRVSGRALSVTWSANSKFLYSGSSDGLIRCWDVRLSREIYRITTGLGGTGSGSELCVWSLLYLRSGTLVSGDSKGSVQFWDCHHGTLLHAQSLHKGDVNALAASPSHNRVFSAGSDGQVMLYKLSSDSVPSKTDKSLKEMKKWVYVGYVRAHTHDVRALAVAVPIVREDSLPDEKNDRKSRKDRCKEKSKDFSYHKWAHIGVPMLISAGDDTKLFAYSVAEFTKFSPHDICPAPQRIPIQLVVNTSFDRRSLLLVQASNWLDILCVKSNTTAFTDASRKNSIASVNCLARVESKGSRKIICSAISNSGVLIAYSHQVQPCLLELKRSEVGKSGWTLNKRRLPRKLPFAHSMIFSSDSSRLMMAGHDRRIYVLDVERSELVHTFTPCRELCKDGLPPNEPPITKMFTSSDGQWLAAVNCFGDIYIFNLEILRQHWFISRLDGASVAAGGFPPQQNLQQHNNILVITTSSNQVYVFDVEARQLGEWSSRYTISLPQRYQEFPGEVIGLSFAPSSSSSSVVVYSARARCSIDFGGPVDCDDVDMVDFDLMAKNIQNLVNGRHKRKLRDGEKESKPAEKNFKFSDFKHPVLFMGHLSINSLLVIDKPWSEVVRNLEAPPVHRHIFGT